MKILLIDDKANEGWKQLLQKVFPIPGMMIETATDFKTAMNKISDKYDLIFLDVRLNSQDHENHIVEEFSGYKILKEIKKKFLSENFATPIILLTASNKIWTIDAFRNYGVDGYYIKEHPDNIFDRETSRQNYNNFKENFKRLIRIGNKRNEIWNLSKEIIDKISTHNYFQGDKRYENVKSRIIDKLKLGYVYLFKEQSIIEKDLLKTNNESLAFIIYWSILEELVKGFTDINSTWNSVTYERKVNWKFRNKDYFIENRNDGNININYSNKTKTYKKEITSYKIDEFNYKRPFLSQQVNALLASYADSQKFKKLSSDFTSINEFRNEIDFIHSQIKTIFEKQLIREENLKNAYDKCINVLSFISDILELI